MRQSEKIARVMCEVTRKELWNKLPQSIKSRRQDVAMVLKVGAGSKHSIVFDPVIGPFKISYSSSQIEQQFIPQYMGLSATAERIRRQKLFNEEVTLLNVLTQTMIEQFVVVEMAIESGAALNEIDKIQFQEYRIGSYHSSGRADEIKEILHEGCLKMGLDLEAFSDKSQKLYFRSDFKSGSRVEVLIDKYKSLNPFTITSAPVGQRIEIKSLKEPGVKLSCPIKFAVPIASAEVASSSNRSTSDSFVDEALLAMSVRKKPEKSKKAKQIKKQQALML